MTSKIEWTDATWNPVTGCSKISPGCKHCYAERMAKRLQAMDQPKYQNGFAVTVHPDALDAPLGWKRPRRIFVNSMSDLFHDDVPADFIRDVFQTMTAADWHQYQVLTKRPGRVVDLEDVGLLYGTLPWPAHIWLGASVESADYVHRIEILRQTGACVKFLSLEPLLSPLPDLDMTGIDWVIVGGESGPGARPMDADWVRDIRDQCLAAGTPFFFKQWGGIFKKRNGRLLDGRTWDETPEALK